MATSWSPPSFNRPPIDESVPQAPARRLSQAEFDQVWTQVKYAMAACNSAVESAQLAWRVQGQIPGDAVLHQVRERCQRASAEVGEVGIPQTARAGVDLMMGQARDSCQRSMVEKQLGMVALRRLAEAPPNSLEAYEARIRMEAISRSSINCGAGFAAAAATARLRMTEMEIAGA